jgi:hypothetical protein
MSLDTEIRKAIEDCGYEITETILLEIAELSDIVEDENQQLAEDEANFSEDSEPEWDDEDGDEPIDPASE